MKRKFPSWKKIEAETRKIAKRNLKQMNEQTKPIDDGGPAFPMGYHRDGNASDHFGASKRFWCATMAMQALAPKAQDGTYYLNDVAAEAFMLADAMIAAEKEAK